MDWGSYINIVLASIFLLVGLLSKNSIFRKLSALYSFYFLSLLATDRLFAVNIHIAGYVVSTMSYIVLILIYFYNYKLIRIQRKFLRKEYIDPLTGLYNRHFLQEIAKPELRATEELSRGYVAFFMDVDNLKDINDTKGHYMGDMLLSIVGETIRKTLRKGLDIAIRYGGDEFLLIAPIKVCSEALTIVHRLEASFDSIDGAQEIKPSVSIGFACFPEDGKDLDELIRIADQRMYSIKRKKKTSGDFHKG